MQQETRQLWKRYENKNDNNQNNKNISRDAQDRITMSTSTLKESCISILRSIYSHDIGFPVLPSVTDTQSVESQLSPDEVQLLSLYDKLSSLTIERKTLEAEITALDAGGMFFNYIVHK